MPDKRNKLLPVCVAVTMSVFATIAGTAIAQKVDKSIPKPQRTLALGEDEVKQLVLLMDADKNGRVSKQEFLSFMSAEFDRLDVDKSGELDVKELAQSQIRPSRAAVGK
jgi:hypothetical protein